SGSLTGTPPAAGTVTFNVKVTDSSDNTYTGTFMLPVNPSGGMMAPLAITTSSQPTPATAGMVYSLQFAATGGSIPYSWSASGLRASLRRSPSGLLLGTPETAATITFNVTVTDSTNATSSGTFMLPVNPNQGLLPLAITTTSPLPAATAGTT